MSPKSRGRPAGRGKPKSRRRQPGPARKLAPADQAVLNAAEIMDEFDVLDAERWASWWLGTIWMSAEIGDRESELRFCSEVVDRACSKPSKRGLAAVTALRRVAPESAFALLDEAIELLSQKQPAPRWAACPPFEAVKAWRAVDVWDSERVLFIEYTSGDPMATEHTVMGRVLTVGTTIVSRLMILQAGAVASWASLHAPDEAPMPLVEMPVAEALADLADCLRTTDLVWPREDDDDFVDLRALGWARSRTFLPAWSGLEPISDAEQTRLDAERARLIEAFVDEVAATEVSAVEDEASAGVASVLAAEIGVARSELSSVDDEMLRSLAEVFLDFGEGYLHDRPLGWSPEAVAMFLSDWLPRKVFLDSEQRAALPAALRCWLHFALRQRGVEPMWIYPVVASVAEWLPAFREAFDDKSSWGPGKHVAAELEAGGVDFSDKAAVDQAIRALNAENLARRLTEP